MAVEAKICGLTRPADAALAAAHGAWRLGVIFAWGPRLLDVPRARAIVEAGAGVGVIGVFGSDPVASILERARAAGLAGVQLHADHLPADDLRRLREAGLEVWRVAPVDEAIAGHAGALRRVEADVVLLEPRGGGGRGAPLPLELARAAREGARPVRTVLAGGLTPDSVAEAIRVVGPDGVDVSSGVESAPGIKDSGRLIRFLEIVRDTRSAA